MIPRPRATEQGGFTLLEVMLSMAIVASMMSLMWGAFSLGAHGKRRAEAIADRYYQVRLTLNRMVRELSMAYLSKNDEVAPIVPRTYFVSEHNSKVDELIFAYLGHVRLRENAKECDQAMVRYYAAPDPEDRGRTHLMRRETRRIGAERPEEEGPAYITLEDVEELHFEFFDEQSNEWRETWNTRSADGQPDRLPSKIRIALTILDERGKPLTMTTAARVQMQEAIWFQP